MADKLSKDVMQHCQSTLTEKEAARIAAVSKTCYHAWATLAMVDFNDQDHGDYIAEVATRMVTRYEAENLKLDSFRLWSAEIDRGLAKNLIERALKLGASEIAIYVGDDAHGKFNLPTTVLGSEHIRSLCAQGCIISLDQIKCFSLKTLHLAKVCVVGDLFNDFILKCNELVEVALCHTENLTGSVDLDDSWESVIGQSKVQSLELIGIDRGDNMVLHA
ncbi:hypothetical protein SASPL_153342 [Salvia splendens]|uniref:Uncharacterized protein n=1 Tax=Salvia splendens TaxID=180675 RepID=A0A8X8W509_SALSN|nr:hypothetical protein SASPL_153342 [Salvia splendens]